MFSELTLSPGFSMLLVVRKHHRITVATLICSQAWCEKSIESKVKIAGCATVARTTLNEMQKLHKSRYKLIGKVLSSFSQHMNYFNMNNVGPEIFRSWTHWALIGERKTSGIEPYRQERRPRNISGHTTEEVKREVRSILLQPTFDFMDEHVSH